MPLNLTAHATRRRIPVTMRNALVIGALLSGCAQANGENARQVVSANLCADQLVMTLADEDQIASLGPFARDPALSFMHEQARRHHGNRGAAEEMIGLRARLVFLGTFDSRHARNVLKEKNIAFVTLAPWQSLEDGRGQIRLVAHHLGQSARGEALIADIDRELEGLSRLSAAPSRRMSALVLHRRGYVLRTGVVAEMLQIAGLRNAAETLGLHHNGIVPLERLVKEPPDLLVVAQEQPEARDQGEALLLHPALTRLFPPAQRLAVPDRLSICPGPATVALITKFTQDLRARLP